MTEKTVVNQCLKYLNSLPRVRAKKIHGGVYMAGWPDVLAVAGGTAVFLEFKREGLNATPLQLRELQMWATAGAVAVVVHSLKEVKAALAAHSLIR